MTLCLSRSRSFSPLLPWSPFTAASSQARPLETASAVRSAAAGRGLAPHSTAGPPLRKGTGRGAALGDGRRGELRLGLSSGSFLAAKGGVEGMAVPLRKGLTWF